MRASDFTAIFVNTRNRSRVYPPSVSLLFGVFERPECLM
jgi:hypothetical protein